MGDQDLPLYKYHHRSQKSLKIKLFRYRSHNVLSRTGFKRLWEHNARL